MYGSTASWSKGGPTPPPASASLSTQQKTPVPGATARTASVA